jgi:predicted small metal-binding protein
MTLPDSRVLIVDPRGATEESAMKHFDCGTLVPGCAWHTEAPDSAEVVRRAAEHLRSAHGETEVRPDMIDRIKDRVVETPPTRH